jgi:hypothetical protein
MVMVGDLIISVSVATTVAVSLSHLLDFRVVVALKLRPLQVVLSV